MADQRDSLALEEPESDLERFYTVFAGSPEEDVAYAKVFWNSVALHPPLESRLISGDIKQRLKVAHPAQPTKNLVHLLPVEDPQCEQLFLQAREQKKAEERSRYLMRKEMISAAYKPKTNSELQRPTTPNYENETLETMKALQRFE
ncbi:cilia- and flagella-associated protein HOATZ isoform X2 [Latimeria chalumnae]|uniref:cilia- and flagella-associated protein HOATZ isoform X2 n=1 Tax=Latimeria chalumnae TaxID=7897 RepID=UPI00313E07F6